jgi:LysR family nitrogen assimilation transcriptional regulator
MNVRTLENFLRVVEMGSLKAAAGVIRIAQPALTRQIALLEVEFGARLFVRHRRGVTLTEAGEQLRLHAERIVGEVVAAHDAVTAAGRVPTGAVALGLPTSMLYVLSTSVVAAYLRAWPNVFLRVHEAIGHVVEDLLRERRVDVAILISEARNLDNVDLTPLVVEDVCLAGPPDAGLTLDDPVPVARLADLPIILLSPQNRLRLQIETELARFGRRLQTSLEVEGQPLVLDLIKHGIGYTVLPYCAIEAEIAAGRISGAPIVGLTMTWTLGVNRMRAHTPAVRELIALIRQAVDARVASGEWRVAQPGTEPAIST